MPKATFVDFHSCDSFHSACRPLWKCAKENPQNRHVGSRPEGRSWFIDDFRKECFGLEAIPKEKAPRLTDLRARIHANQPTPTKEQIDDNRFKKELSTKFQFSRPADQEQPGHHTGVRASRHF